MLSNNGSKRGFTLVELVIGVAILSIIALAVHQAFTVTLQPVRLSRVKAVATSLANEELEAIRNMPYSSVGLQSGVPAGTLPRFKTMAKSGIVFFATTTIRNMDDPFDGQVGSSTANDLAPADYKLVELELQCIQCAPGDSLSFVTTVVPRGLETSTNNGSLFVRVFDANGQPVTDANVQVINTSVTPNISINEITNASGILQLVDVPTSTDTYRITVSKPGYSTDMTYAQGDAANPNPVKGHASVITQQLTQASFAIDVLSNVTITTVDATCQPIGNTQIRFAGSKLIGTSPDILKYDQTRNTNASGTAAFNDIEWDTYAVTAGSGKYLAGSIPLLPISVAPNSTIATTFIVLDADPGAALITIKDSSNNLPISGATVEIVRSGVPETLTTGQGFWTQTDWSGGAGQTVFSDDSMYESSDGNIDAASTVGEVRLADTLGVYAPSGQLISSVFDTGTTSNFYTLTFLPVSQPAQAGSDPIKFQLASSDDAATTTWSYLGPDGTSGTYYTTSGQTIAAAVNGKRYIRYKMILETADTAFTPRVSDIAVTYSTACTPPGQVYFSNLIGGTYDITVTASGYQTYGGQITVDGSGYITSEIQLSTN